MALWPVAVAAAVAAQLALHLAAVGLVAITHPLVTLDLIRQQVEADRGVLQTVDLARLGSEQAYFTVDQEAAEVVRPVWQAGAETIYSRDQVAADLVVGSQLAAQLMRARLLGRHRRLCMARIGRSPEERRAVVLGPLEFPCLVALCGTKLARQVEQAAGRLRQPWLVVLAVLAVRMAQAAAAVALVTAQTLLSAAMAALVALV
jgi:hypothetical protein